MQFPFFKKKATNVIEYTPEMKKADSYFGALLNSLSTIRRTFGGGNYGFSPDGKRNYNELYGYGTSLGYDDYLGMYKRGGIAKTIVDKVVKACWRDVPELTVNETRILEEELLMLKRTGFFRAMERADILNRIGKFSVLLLGLPDGQDLDKPLGSVGGGDSYKNLYFNAYAYKGIEILKWDNDPSSPRFDQPVIYQLQSFVEDTASTKKIGVRTFKVHYTRIVHFAEGALDSDIEGTSALEAPWNALTDKDKVRGGSGEAYFRNSRQKLALETEKDATIDTSDKAMKALKENVEGFQNGWEDVLRLNKMSANMLQPGLVSPRDPFDVCIEEVSGTTGIPVRFLTSKGGGNLTGSEDKAAWNSLIADRCDQECSVWLLKALTIYAEAGLFDLPDEVEVEWPVQKSLNEKEASEAMANRAKAFKDTVDALSTVGADEVITESAFKAVGFDEVEFDAMDFTDDQELDDDLPDENTPPAEE